jgi:hypothetical protein
MAAGHANLFAWVGIDAIGIGAVCQRLSSWHLPLLLSLAVFADARHSK